MSGIMGGPPIATPIIYGAAGTGLLLYGCGPSTFVGGCRASYRGLKTLWLYHKLEKLEAEETKTFYTHRQIRVVKRQIEDLEESVARNAISMIPIAGPFAAACY